VAELQSDDYHNDRQLFYACRDDREVLCPHIKSGDGRVYRCLYRHKFERKMSDDVCYYFGLLFIHIRYTALILAIVNRSFGETAVTTENLPVKQKPSCIIL